MLDSVKTPFNECIATLQKEMKLDPYFLEFYKWSKENNVPIVVLSSGMVPIIRALFEAFLGEAPDDHLHIVANTVESRDGKDINSEGGWQIKYHDESHFGHDKSLEIKPYAALPDNVRPTLLYAGDGVSDLSAASETDLLFAKKGKGEILSRETYRYPPSHLPGGLTSFRSGDFLPTSRTAVHRVCELGVYSCHHKRHPQWQGVREEGGRQLNLNL
ncbi:putative Phosphoserine phosphatase [Aspergillus melleus]|uniref:putative Phosphoserine phosphatase n=1 Tax=Aspergillus melleus TaxID=138277 RepID=UPI001E8ED99A|nr:uncharacterized protein LDX57_005677 [Aspergillus melleus]KAH8427971.1 hypothetical protein LDX57_005677 [Aspergillus melleus]